LDNDDLGQPINVSGSDPVVSDIEDPVAFVPETPQEVPAELPPESSMPPFALPPLPNVETIQPISPITPPSAPEESFVPVQTASPAIESSTQPEQYYAPQPSAAVTPTLPSEPAVPTAEFPVSNPEPHPAFAQPGLEAWKQDLQNAGPKKFSFNKKVIISFLVGILIVSILGVAAFYGYKYYVSLSNIRILQKAATKLASEKQMSTNVTVGYDSFFLTGKLDIDKDQDARLSIENDFFPIKLYYLKNKDALYFESVDFDFSTDLTGSGTTSTEKKTLMEYKNVTKAVDLISANYVNIKNFDPKKNYFTKDNQEFIKKEKDESIGGNDYYKFKFQPSEEYLNKVINDLKKEKASSLVDFSKTSLVVSVWIEKSSFRISKLEGEVGVTSKTTGSVVSDSGTSQREESIKYTWKEEFDYSFSEDIKLPIGVKVTNSYDAAEVVNEAISSVSTAQSTSEDTPKRSNAKTVQVALEAFYARNKRYPNSLTEITNDTYLPGQSEIDMADFIYTATSTGDDFLLTYKLSGGEEERITSSGTEYAQSYYDTSPADSKARDAKNKAILHELQNALEQYFLDNDSTYPIANDANSMKDQLVSSELLSESTSITDITYTHSSSPEGYILSFVLFNQDDTADNVVGTPPNRTYQVTNKQ
jgi:Tfp pilus assembly protein PilE